MGRVESSVFVIAARAAFAESLGKVGAATNGLMYSVYRIMRRVKLRKFFKQL